MQRGNGAVIGKQNTPTTSVATGVWALNEVQRAVLGGNWPASTIVDPYFENVSLLLHGNGTNGAQNNTFLDSSTNNFTITRNGNTTQGTFTPYGSNWSNYFDGTDDFIYVADSSAFTLGSGDFTVEAWVWTGVTSTQKVISGQINGAGDVTSLSYQLDISSSDFPRIIVASGSTTYIATSSTTLPKNQWVHVAGVRDGSTLRIYVNGVQYGTQSVTGVTVNDSSANVSVGRHGQYAGLDWNGYISNFRLVKGTCVYPSGTTFTPSTAPLTAITNTSLLTCQSNRFIDNSTNNFTITRNGDVSVQRFSPFNPTTPYAAGTIGGSGYFDGSGDFLNGPTTGQFAPTGDFTISMWFYPTSFAASYYVLAGSWNAGASDEWLIQYDNTGAIRFLTTTDSTFSASGVVKLNQWQFLSISRSGSTVTGYINGTSFRSYTLTGTVGSATKTVYVGIQAGTTWPYVGYISDYRLVAGSAQSATPPTSPATAISGTNTLLNFTNGGIIDNAMMNDLETVGNAQISTSVSKFGGGSLAFDGTGDWLLTRTSPNLDLGTGDFTFECWLYITNTIIDYRMLVSDATNGSNYITLRGGGTGGQVEVNVNGTSFRINLNNSISQNVWAHFAVVRTGSTFTAYVNGVSLGTGSSSGAFNLGNGGMYVGRFGGGTAYEWPGYIDDLRITKGYARYTANFTAPTLPFPDQ